MTETDDAAEDAADDATDSTAHDDDGDVQVACRLSEAGKDERRGGWVHGTFVDELRDVEEREDGYEFVFEGSDEVLEAVSTFLQRETACCPFARFRVDVSPGLETVRLLFAGPEGTKELLEDGLFEDGELALGSA